MIIWFPDKPDAYRDRQTIPMLAQPQTFGHLADHELNRNLIGMIAGMIRWGKGLLSAFAARATADRSPAVLGREGIHGPAWIASVLQRGC